MACLWAKDPPKFEDLLPPDEDAPEPEHSALDDAMLAIKMDIIMAQMGGVKKADIADPTASIGIG